MLIARDSLANCCRYRCFTFISVAVFLLWLTIAWMWARSLRRVDHLSYLPRPRHLYEIASGHGQVVLLRERGPEDVEPRTDSPAADATTWEEPAWVYRFGVFEVQDLDPTEPPGEPWCTSGELISISYLSIFSFSTLLLSVVAGGWGWNVSRHRWLMSSGHCLACGYDLRASPGRCPECGREHSPKPG